MYDENNLHSRNCIFFTGYAIDKDCPKYTPGKIFDIKHVELERIKVIYMNGPLEKKENIQLFRYTCRYHLCKGKAVKTFYMSQLIVLLPYL